VFAAVGGRGCIALSQTTLPDANASTLPPTHSRRPVGGAVRVDKLALVPLRIPQTLPYASASALALHVLRRASNARTVRITVLKNSRRKASSAPATLIIRSITQRHTARPKTTPEDSADGARLESQLPVCCLAGQVVFSLVTFVLSYCASISFTCRKRYPFYDLSMLARVIRQQVRG